MTAADVALTNDTAQHRYEARIDGGLAGYLEYQLTDEIAVISHTEVPAAFEGRGVGSALARHALDDIAEHSTRSIIVLCPFVLAWLERHPEYKRLTYGHRPPG